MLISTRGRYALRAMLDIAQNQGDGHVPIRDVAKRQEISLKYLEKIMPALVKNNLVEGVHGKGGGYKLTRDPGDYTLGDILRVTERDLAPVACLEKGAEPCPRAPECKTLPVWKKLYGKLNEFFDGLTLADLLD